MYTPEHIKLKRSLGSAAKAPQGQAHLAMVRKTGPSLCHLVLIVAGWPGDSAPDDLRDSPYSNRK